MEEKKAIKEEKVVKKETKKSNPLLVTILVVVLMGVCCAGGWLLGSTKIIEKVNTNCNSSKKESSVKEESKTENNTTDCIDEVKTKVCKGVYEGEGAVTADAQTGKKNMGKLKVTLNEDGTFSMAKMDSNGNQITEEIGKYVIYENTAFLKTKPHTAATTEEANTYSTTGYFKVSDDCSTIKDGYGSFFMDSNFTLNRK